LTNRAIRKVKEDKLQSLKDALAKGTNVEIIKRFYVSLPANEAHQKHYIGPIAGGMQKVSPIVVAKINELVKEGYTDVAEKREVQRICKSRI